MILDDIIAHKRHEVDDAKERNPISALEQRITVRKQSSFRKAIASADHTSLIAEIKKASPSRGLLCSDFDPSALAQIYAENGASAISVLTDMKYFQGEPSHLTKAKKTSGLPVLRKDFIVDEYQIWESAAMGADAVLLIVAALAPGQLYGYFQLATQTGLDALVEVHDMKELKTALDSGARIIGINNRDLKTFKTDLRTTLELAPEVPADHIIVSESGIHTRQDVSIVRQAGVHAILVGEALVTSEDIPRKIRELIGAPS